MTTAMAAKRMAKRLQQNLRNGKSKLDTAESHPNCFVMRNLASRQAAALSASTNTANDALLSIVAYVADAVWRLHVRYVFLQGCVPGLFKALDQYYKQPALATTKPDGLISSATLSLPHISRQPCATQESCSGSSVLAFSVKQPAFALSLEPTPMSLRYSNSGM